jgi:hypothetical protein
MERCKLSGSPEMPLKLLLEAGKASNLLNSHAPKRGALA